MSPQNLVPGQWTWVSGSNQVNQLGTYGTKGVEAPGNTPGARRGSVSWTDTNGNLWLFGGMIEASSGYEGLRELNDLWMFNTASGLWTWVSGSNQVNQTGTYGTKGVAAPGNIPGARYNAVSWADAGGNLWLFGGVGYAATSGKLNDLWKFNIPGGQWTWVSGSNQANQAGIYGTKGVAAPGNIPGCPYGSVSWTDASGNLWLFGGIAEDSASRIGYMNHLWRFNISSGQWTWVSGSDSGGQAGTYGTKGVGAPGNVPGARAYSASWTDANGNFWLFGGYLGRDPINDLWKWDVSCGQWTWVSGSDSPGQAGTYGTPGVGAPENVPGARLVAASWADTGGNLWLFGGSGNEGELNDLWNFNIENGQWTWVSGSNQANQAGTYGTKGVAAPGNIPGARDGSVSWTDSSGNLWLFGGGAFKYPDYLFNNDLWVISNALATAPSTPKLLLPVVLDNVVGVGGSQYTTELTLASKATTPVQASLLYTASVGTGTGAVPVTLAPGQTLIIPDALAYLRSQGLAIPTSGEAIGTLLATFAGASSSSDPSIGGRTFTTGDGGTFGLFYSAAATTTTTATLVGLQDNSAQRSNLALVNAGGFPISLSVQLFGPMGENLGTLPVQTLLPFGWAQINRPLQGKAASGRAVVTSLACGSPFTAYAVLNDAVTSDGSFIPPLLGNDSGPGDLLVPIVLDVHGLGGAHYTTELTLANLTTNPMPVTLGYTASLGSGSGQAALTLAPGEQRIVPDTIGFLRSQGLAIPNDGSSVGGSLLAVPPTGTSPSGFAVGARTFTPAPAGGSFGLYYPGLTLAESATSVVYINGLQQNSAQRSNVAVVNRGDASDSITLNISYFDGTGAALGTPTMVTLTPGQWWQVSQPLQVLGATSGYAKIQKTSGNSRFVAYGVLNDAVTSDGSYIPMSW